MMCLSVKYLNAALMKGGPLFTLHCNELHRRSMILPSFLKDHICLCFLDYGTGVSVRANPVLKTIFIKYNRHPVVYISYTANSFSGEFSQFCCENFFLLN